MTAPFPTVSLVFPDGGQVTMAVPGIPRVGDSVSARWGADTVPRNYAVTGVVWDLNERTQFNGRATARAASGPPASVALVPAIAGGETCE